MNPHYEQIGKAFTEQYYNLFDNPATRANLSTLYNAEQSLMSFEGQAMQGTAKIMEKIQSLTFQKIAHLVTAVDCQPMFDGGVLVNVLGQLKTDEDQAHGFTQNFVLRPIGNSWFIQHDIFRLALHDIATN